MNRPLEQSDLILTYQHVLNLSIRVEVYDKDMNFVETMDCGLVSGTFNMDANSDVRRTASIVVSPNVRSQISFLIEEDSLTWINRNIVLQVGIQDHRTQEYTYYKLGTFVIMTYTSTYDATTNQLTLNCSDWMAKLDGSKNGELSSLITSFPSYKEFYSTEETGGTDCYYFTSDKINYSDGVFQVDSEVHTSYVFGDYVVLQMGQTNIGEDQFQWNDLEPIPIYDEATGKPIASKMLLPDLNYAFRFDKTGVLTLTSGLPIEKVEDGVPLDYFTIRESMKTALLRLSEFKKDDFEIDNLGEFLGMEQYNKEGWEQYRLENPLWDNVPYDLEFNVGDNVLSIITTLRDLYPNYETYFDEDGVFCCNMVPSQIADDPYLVDEYLQEILISENYDIDTSSIRNITEVYGASLETDFTADECTYNPETCQYTINIPEYGDTIFNSDKIAIELPETNGENASVIIHTIYTEASGDSTVEKEKTFDPLPIYDESTDAPLEAGYLDVGILLVFKVRVKLIRGKYPEKVLYYQSEYQPHAMDVLTDGTVSDEDWTCQDGTVVKVWSKEYFADRHNCKLKNIHFTIDEKSALTIQKLGEILIVKSGDVYENITSDQRAVKRAIWETWKSARLVDAVTINTKLCLFADVNKKVTFRRHDKEEEEQYVITSVSHDFQSGTTTMSLAHFYPLYVDAQ